FDEQGDAVGALDDILPDALRQHLVADEVVDHRADFALRQSLDGEGTHVRLPDPGRGTNSGRNVTINSTGRVAIRSTARPNASRLVGSVQCASSKIIRTGLERVRA